MKKILYISDFTLEQYNSVRDILYNLITHQDMVNYEQVIVKSTGRMHNPIKKDIYDVFKTYSNMRMKTLEYLKRDISFGRKIGYIYHKFLYKMANMLNLTKRYRKYDNVAYINSVIKEEKPQLVVFLIYSPQKEYVELCQKYHIPYIFILYDTYIGRPKVNKEIAYKTEKFVIENSKGYYIPDFFYDLYSKTYTSEKIKCMDLPLLTPEKDVIESYENCTKKFDFAYFGLLQSFRNGEEVKKLFRSLNIKLDIFSTEKYESDETFQVHPAITQKELHSVVASSKFLVVLDNSFPFQEYLPSKSYLYASFTKPIIAFGDNESSALKDFFDGYKWFYYQNIKQSTDGLVEFLNGEFPDCFDVESYSKFSRYLPEIALKSLIDNIRRVLS
jgi:hypothetical protein